MQFLDARFAAEDWIKTHIPKNTTLEIYTQPRYLPRVSDHVDFNLTGNSLDVISYEILPDDFTTAAFAARNPEYVLVMRGVRLTGDPDEMTEAVAVDFFQQLLTGKLGYQQIAYFETPNWLPFAQITAGTLPKIYLLQRQSTVEE